MNVPQLRCLLVSVVVIREIRPVAEVQAESLYEAAILGMRVFKSDPWIEYVGPATIFDVRCASRAQRTRSACGSLRIVGCRND
jgi:hypothetical protein